MPYTKAQLEDLTDQQLDEQLKSHQEHISKTNEGAGRAECEQDIKDLKKERAWRGRITRDAILSTKELKIRLFHHNHELRATDDPDWIRRHNTRIDEITAELAKRVEKAPLTLEFRLENFTPELLGLVSGALGAKNPSVFDLPEDPELTKIRVEVTRGDTIEPGSLTGESIVAQRLIGYSTVDQSPVYTNDDGTVTTKKKTIVYPNLVKALSDITNYRDGDLFVTNHNWDLEQLINEATALDWGYTLHINGSFRSLTIELLPARLVKLFKALAG